MLQNVKYLAVMWAAAAALVGLGVYACRRKRPMWFWTGEKISPSEIRDVAAYNRANGRMWCLCSVPYWIVGLIELWYPSASIIFFALTCVAGIAWVVWYHNRIEEKYRKR